VRQDATPESEAVQPTALDKRGDEVVFIVSFDLKPGCDEEFLALLMPVLDAMRHETTFINAVLHRDPEDPSRFMLYETWADLDDVAQVQIQRAYRQAYWARLPDLLREPRQIETWHPMRRDFTFFASA
jgi:quinol monooxygenase YgiN